MQIDLKPEFLYSCAAIMLVVAISGFFQGLGGLDPLENSIYDAFMTLKVQKQANNNIVIVEIDEKSLKKIGHWPWKRSVTADVINYINKAKPAVIALNILFSEETPDDKPLLDSIKASKSIVTPFVYEQGSVVFPLKEIKEYSTVADVSTFTGKDGTVRKTYKKPYLPDYSSFATATVNHFNTDASKNLPKERFFYINFLQKTNLFEHYSFNDVYTGKVKPDKFKNKIVLIGITAEGLSKLFNTPLSGRIEKSISGTELQAHIINTIISNKFIYKCSYGTLFIIIIFSNILLIYLLKMFKPLQQALVITTFVLATLIISYLLFAVFSYWIMPSGIMLSNLLIYSYCTIRTLSSVDKTVDKAITELSLSEDLPMKDLSHQLEDGVMTLSELTRVINNDRQMIKAILNAINFPVLLIDSDAAVLWKNMQAKNVQKINNLGNLTDLDIDLQNLKTSLDSENFYKQEVVILDREYMLIITPANEDKTSFACVFNDITEFKNLDRLKTDLIRTVSHEIRTPLTLIQLDCDIATEMNDLETANKSLNSIYEKTENLTELVTEFLDLNKLEANMVELELKELNLIPLVQDTVDQMKEFAKSKSITVNLVVDNLNEINIMGDKMRLKQVFMNFISNAIKYSPENTEVLVKIERTNTYVVVFIKDQGYGLSEEDKIKIFDKFYRVKSDETKKISGTGLGLAIVKKIIEMHSGNIRVESQQGKGSSFIVSIPLPDNT